MGFLREKYTKEYFLSKDEKGNRLNYGALGGEEFLNGEIYKDIKKSLSLISNYKGANILEIGFGRGESIKFFNAKKANSYYGIDFSKDAYDLANKHIMKTIDNKDFLIFCDDALDHLKNHFEELSKKNINVVILLDAIEHIPCDEIKAIFDIINRLTKDGCIFIGHTPFYKYDEDYCKSKEYIDPSYTDLIEETKGMHCNKYTKKRFLAEFKRINFYPKKKNRLFIKTSPIKGFFYMIKNALRV